MEKPLVRLASTLNSQCRPFKFPNCCFQVAAMELIGYLVGTLVLEPVIFVFQAIVGVLAAGDSPKDRRDRNLVIAFTLAGVVAISVPLLLALPGWRWALGFLVSGFVLLGVASRIGYSLERRRLEGDKS